MQNPKDLNGVLGCKTLNSSAILVVACHNLQKWHSSSRHQPPTKKTNGHQKKDAKKNSTPWIPCAAENMEVALPSSFFSRFFRHEPRKPWNFPTRVLLDHTSRHAPSRHLLATVTEGSASWARSSVWLLHDAPLRR